MLVQKENPRPRVRVSGRKDMTVRKISAMTTSMAVMARIAIVAAVGTGLATAASGVANAVLESDRAIKRDVAAVVWDR